MRLLYYLVKLERAGTLVLAMIVFGGCYTVRYRFVIFTIRDLLCEKLTNMANSPLTKQSSETIYKVNIKEKQRRQRERITVACT